MAKHFRKITGVSASKIQAIRQEVDAVAWSSVGWTPFRRVEIPDAPINRIDPPADMFANSRYQVTVYKFADRQFGEMLHLSIKTHDRSPRHDWRDLQRIKNEIAGPECYAVEIFPAESRLVDSANQYHLYVFLRWMPPFGFSERLVGDGEWNRSKQRPFDTRPADCLDPDQFDELYKNSLHRKDPYEAVSQEVSRRLALDSSIVVRQYKLARESTARITQGGDGDAGSKGQR